jgi:hypothetical protein
VVERRNGSFFGKRSERSERYEDSCLLGDVGTKFPILSGADTITDTMSLAKSRCKVAEHFRCERGQVENLDSVEQAMKLK